MGLRPLDVWRFGVVPAVEQLGPRFDSTAARVLLFGTAAKESGGFRHLYQYPAGPAVGLGQMEPLTFRDIVDRAIVGDAPWKVDARRALRMLSAKVRPEPLDLAGNMPLAFALVRLKYFLAPRWSEAEPLPPAWDPDAQGDYWKRYYNTPLGAGRPEEYVESWHIHCEPTLRELREAGNL